MDNKNEKLKQIQKIASPKKIAQIKKELEPSKT
jgi:hypothetical protein